MKLKPSLIPEARRAWRYFTVQVGVLAVIFGLLPPNQQAAVLDWLGVAPERVPAVLGAVFIIARYLKQTPRDEA
jgi:hypothetical protein